MQILEYPSVEAVALPNAEDDMSNNNSQKSQPVPWGTIFATAIFVGGFLWVAHTEIEKINDHLTTIEKHLSKVETAVRIVGAKEGNDTKTLVDEALTVAQNAVDSGRTDSAVAALNAVGNLLKDQPLKEKDATKEIGAKSPALSRAGWHVTNAALTAYSLSFPPPPLDESKMIYLHVTNPAAECITIGRANKQIIQDIIFENCTAHIDALFGPQAIAQQVYISDSIFKNARIIYSGGPLQMKGVYFENCTFDFEPSRASESVAEQLLSQNQPFNLFEK
jgi:hypothetical protein